MAYRKLVAALAILFVLSLAGCQYLASTKITGASAEATRNTEDIQEQNVKRKILRILPPSTQFGTVPAAPESNIRARRPGEKKGRGE
tara:strand:+ start:2633 stop:2893 length:261 start_codon:yes stop_codon:yes gene_type:complete